MKSGNVDIGVDSLTLIAACIHLEEILALYSGFFSSLFLEIPIYSLCFLLRRFILRENFVYNIRSLFLSPLIKLLFFQAILCIYIFRIEPEGSKNLDHSFPLNYPIIGFAEGNGK